MNDGMNERIRKLRKHLDLTQQEFADKIRVKRNTVATYEMGRSIPSDAAISLICSEFNVNEIWLKTGDGEIFKPVPNDVLDALAKEYNLSHNQYIFIKKFVDLKKERFDDIIAFLKDVISSIDDSVPDLISDIPNTAEALEKQHPPVDSAKKRTR